MALEPWERPVQVPARVEYKRADRSVLKTAVETLQKILAPDYQGEQRLFPELALIGPFLWADLRNESAFAKIPDAADSHSAPINWKFQLGTRRFSLPGRVMRAKDAPDLLPAVESALRGGLAKDGPFTVRSLTSVELDFLWTLYPFDSVDEPIFIVESKKHKFLIQMRQDAGFLIDDYRDISNKRIQELNRLESH